MENHDLYGDYYKKHKKHYGKFMLKSLDSTWLKVIKVENHADEDDIEGLGTYSTVQKDFGASVLMF